MLRLPLVVAVVAAAVVRAAPAEQIAGSDSATPPSNSAGADPAWQTLERKLAELLYKLQRQQEQQQRRGDAVSAASASLSQIQASIEGSDSRVGESSDKAYESRVDMEEAAESDRSRPLPPVDSLPARELEKHSAYTSRCRGTPKACQSAYIMGTRQYPDDSDPEGGGERLRQNYQRVSAAESSVRGNPADTAAAEESVAAVDTAILHPIARQFPWSSSKKSLRLELLKRKLVDLYELVDDLERDNYDDEALAAAWAG